MSYWHGYFAAEDLALTEEQRLLVWQVIKDMNYYDSNYAHFKNHSRMSLDGTKIIVEARFDTDGLTVNAFKQKLADAVGVSTAIITSSSTNVTFVSLPTPVVTFGAGGTDRLRVALFGGTNATWEQSLVEVTKYLKNNIAEWED